MPTLDTLQLPRIDTSVYGGREAKKIASHLYQVEEQLRYVLGHLDEDNLSEGLKARIESGGASSEILQTLDAITLRVSGQDDAMAELRITLGGITTTVQEQGGAISELRQTAESITSTVQANKELSEEQAAAALEKALQYTDLQLTNYPTSAQMSSAIEQTAANITSTVAAVYSTKTETTAAADAARDAAQGYTDDALTGYTTTVEMQSIIDQRAESITSTVAATYATQKSVADGDAAAKADAAADAAAKADAARDAAQGYTDDALTAYTTTVEMQSMIEQTAGSVTSTVEKHVADNYATKTSLSTVQQTADKINWVVKSGESATDFTLTDRAVRLVADTIDLSGKVSFSDLSTAGRTDIIGNNIKTGVIESEAKNTRYDLDNGTIQTGSSTGAHVYMDDRMIRWYLGENLPTGIFYSITGYTWIGANSRYTYFGWMTNGLPEQDNAAHWRGMAVDNVSSRTWFNTAHVDVANGALGVNGKINCNELEVNGSGAKKAVVPTGYGVLSLYATESPAPCYHDWGGGVCDADGICSIFLDERFLAVISAIQTRRWSLTSTSGEGSLWAEDTAEGAIVHGKPGQRFDWVCFAAQRGVGGLYAEPVYDENTAQIQETPDVLQMALTETGTEEAKLEELLLEGSV